MHVYGAATGRAAVTSVTLRIYSDAPYVLSTNALSASKRDGSAGGSGFDFLVFRLGLLG